MREAQSAFREVSVV
jgi:hypothetical protein